jgi:SOS-response transcriptional repressor LexA
MSSINQLKFLTENGFTLVFDESDKDSASIHVKFPNGFVASDQAAKNLLDIYNQKEFNSKAVLNVTKATNNSVKPDTLAYTHIKLPIIGTVTAGPNGPAYTEYLGEEWTDKEDINCDAKYYWLQVRGESMIGERIMPGDLALVREQPDIESGELAIVIANGEEGTLKRVYKKENSIVLQSANATYPPRIFSGTELNSIKIAGKVKVTKRKY